MPKILPQFTQDQYEHIILLLNKGNDEKPLPQSSAADITIVLLSIMYIMLLLILILQISLFLSINSVHDIIIDNVNNIGDANTNDVCASWIVDIDATNHLTFYSHMLCSHQAISIPKTSKVYLPIGSEESVSHTKNTMGLDGHSISTILCIPDLRFNLLFVSILTRELQCSVNFFLDFSILQDLYTGMVRGIGREDQRLYVLDRNL